MLKYEKNKENEFENKSGMKLFTLCCCRFFLLPDSNLN